MLQAQPGVTFVFILIYKLLQYVINQKYIQEVPELSPQRKDSSMSLQKLQCSIGFHHNSLHTKENVRNALHSIDCNNNSNRLYLVCDHL